MSYNLQACSYCQLKHTRGHAKTAWTVQWLLPPPQSCLQRSFKAEVFSCPNCRHALQKDLAMQVNTPLQQVLVGLFPGYDAGR